uniref:Uncharacterized protein n=1 Tax=Magnetococcus massalia (strain MO-1) TaxID=451514 RepID=A0A1S7LG14_MAGMO|nr:protein of unknown function [Candidatus Magnetococcus massalia]
MQTGGGELLHDPRGALGADHALVQRVVGVALDVTYLTISQCNSNTAAAGAHIASGRLDFHIAIIKVALLGRVLHGISRSEGATFTDTTL